MVYVLADRAWPGGDAVDSVIDSSFSLSAETNRSSASRIISLESMFGPTFFRHVKIKCTFFADISSHFNETDGDTNLAVKCGEFTLSEPSTTPVVDAGHRPAEGKVVREAPGKAVHISSVRTAMDKNKERSAIRGLRFLTVVHKDLGAVGQASDQRRLIDAR